MLGMFSPPKMRRGLRKYGLRYLFQNQANAPKKDTDQLIAKHRQEFMGTSAMTTERGFFSAACRLMKPYWVDNFIEGLKEQGVSMAAIVPFIQQNGIPKDRASLKQAWDLVKPQQKFREHTFSWLLVAATIALTVYNVTDVSVGFNNWQRDIGDLFQESYNVTAAGPEKLAETWGKFGDLMDNLVLLIGKSLAVGAVSYKAGQQAILRWRKWMTEDFQNRWLENGAFYRMQFVDNPIDNPDQRVQEDPAQFAEFAMDIVTDAVDSVISLATFSKILWDQSGTLFGIPHFMFTLIMSYCTIGTIAMHYGASPLEKKAQKQQQVEGTYRADLRDTDEKAESIYLNDAGDVQKGILTRSFNAVYKNYQSLINIKTALLVAKVVYNRVAGVVPLIATFPALVAGQIKMGGVFQTMSAYSEVRSAMNFYVTNIQKFKEGKANMNRLIEMDDMLNQMKREFNKIEKISMPPPPPATTSTGIASPALG
jgi:putative ATP-binding cassette transporter